MVAREDLPSVAPGLGLGAPSKVSHKLYVFPIQVPYKKMNFFEAMEALPSVAPGLGLDAFQNFPIHFIEVFPMQVPLVT